MKEKDNIEKKSQKQYMAEEKKRIDFCKKYIPVLQMIFDDEELSSWCRQYSIYNPETIKKHESLDNYLYEEFNSEAYECGILILNYPEVLENAGVLEKDFIMSDENLESLSDEQIRACITSHFRADHFNTGSLIYSSVGTGELLRLMKAYLKKSDYDFNKRLESIKELVFERSGLQWGFDTRIFTIENDKVHADISGNFMANEFPSQYIIPKEEFLSGLRKLHICDWQKEYQESGDWVTFDGIDWKLTIIYNDGHDPFESKGTNAYPDNYSEFLAFLGIQEDEEDDEDDEQDI